MATVNDPSLLHGIYAWSSVPEGVQLKVLAYPNRETGYHRELEDFLKLTLNLAIGSPRK